MEYSNLEEQQRNVDADKDAQKYSDTLYHYTSMPALIGILMGKKEIWFGEASLMNDTKELTDFIDKLREACIIHANPQYLQQYRSFFQRITDQIDNNYPFIMSFSSQRDDVAQWERYANDAKGLCLEFNTRYFSKILALFHGYAFLSEVFYEYDINQHELCSIIQEYVEFNQFTHGFNSEKSLIENIFATASGHKHPSFRMEKEIRASISPLFEAHNSISHYPLVKYEFEVRGGIVKKYAKLQLDTVCSTLKIKIDDLFNGILIGPKSQQNTHTLQDYLRKNGYNDLANKVRKSDCPLR